MKAKLRYFLTALLMIGTVLLSGCAEAEFLLENLTETRITQHEDARQVEDSLAESNPGGVVESDFYYDVDDVASYIHQFGRLPDNYITKQEADQRGWSTQDDTYVVGGNRFGNREGKLPTEKGRQYYEADIQAGYTHHRGPERIVFSNDGLIFYTDDHYDSFEQLY